MSNNRSWMAGHTEDALRPGQDTERGDEGMFLSVLLLAEKGGQDLDFLLF